MILALIANGVVLSITLYQRKSWKQSSTIFFTSLILAHLVLNLLYLPFAIIALAAGEWIFGSTDEEKRGTCTSAAFVYSFTIPVIFMTLAAISFDRFLFIVKPHLHKRFMRPWVALTLTIAIWILSAVFGTLPFLDFGHYSYDDELGYCTLVGVDIPAFVAILVIVFLVVGTIFVTSLWTFCFTRSYFKAHYQYDWKLEEAQKNILQTHTTAVSTRMLYKLGQQMGKEFTPVEYFSIDRVFRNKTLDATHLAKFHQIEGVVADYNLTLGDLMGVLYTFFSKMVIAKC
uniref:G-protein coupled receptors family 1 profile domain-containing protein n=1 Tax=Amphimedon queenslandica TaxID=400682 RepID=A0A1X7TAF4_AMPQE